MDGKEMGMDAGTLTIPTLLSQERLLLKSKEESMAHWVYVKYVLTTHKIPMATIDMCGMHYNTAFQHGWKHALEYTNEHKV